MLGQPLSCPGAEISTKIKGGGQNSRLQRIEAKAVQKLVGTPAQSQRYPKKSFGVDILKGKKLFKNFFMIKELQI